MDALNSFLDSLQGDSPTLQNIGKYAYILSTYRPMVQMEIHLILSALFPIIIGSHASLKRPPSAAPPLISEDDEDDELGDAVKEEKGELIPGLTPSDAIIFPITAGLTLGGLYFVIVWLKKADLVNIVMNAYLSVFGVLGVGRLAADTLNVITTFIFPSVWSSRTSTYHVEPLLSEQVTGTPSNSRILTTRTNPEGKRNPFPGFLSSIKFSDSITKKLWTLRAVFKGHWIFRAYVHGMFETKNKVLLNDVIGLVLGFATVIMYNTGASTKAWWLTNVLGINFCYGILQILSPTTFWTGTLVLAGLFIYDVIMVFYTPMMITVAKSLQAPIMLVIPGPGRGSMLGLGDIALPGMVMAMALRFDLYLHYLRKQISVGLDKDDKKSKNDIIRAPYEEATGLWGERFWTRRQTDSDTATAADGARFKKVYFKASIIGYIVAMLVTMAVMHHYKHGQPALLYLVPSVLGAIWGTALVRGEVRLMWEYKEDGEWGFESEAKPKSDPESDSKSKATKKGGDETKLKAMKGFTAGYGANGTELKDDSETEVGDDDSVIPQLVEKKEEKAKTSEKDSREHAHHVFLFSLSTPHPKKGKGVKLL